MDFAKTLKMVRGGDTQEEFAAKIGVHKNTLSRWERGEQEPGRRELLSILKARQEINPAWLLTGEGPMMRAQDRDETEIPLDGEIYMQVTESVLRAVETYPRMPRADTLLGLIRLIHDEVKEGEMRQEEIKKNVVRILKIAS